MIPSFTPPMNELRFFNPYADIRQTENRLPHWQQAGAFYFITFRLADAIPHNFAITLYIEFKPTEVSETRDLDEKAL